MCRAPRVQNESGAFVPGVHARLTRYQAAATNSKRVSADYRYVMAHQQRDLLFATQTAACVLDRGLRNCIVCLYNSQQRADGLQRQSQRCAVHIKFVNTIPAPQLDVMHGCSLFRAHS